MEFYASCPEGLSPHSPMSLNASGFRMSAA